jgi:cell division protein FtsZ
VTIRAAQPRPSFLAEPEPAPAPAQIQEDDDFAPYIPPPSQRMRTTRMPRVDELPLPAQNQIRAQRGEPPVEQAQPDKKRMTLLQRLAHVGRREEPEPEPVRREQQTMRAPERRPAEPRYQDQRPVAGGRPAEAVSEFAKRPQTRPVMEVPSRPAPQRGDDDDHLDIPAFLRRQAN